MIYPQVITRLKTFQRLFIPWAITMGLYSLNMMMLERIQNLFYLVLVATLVLYGLISCFFITFLKIPAFWYHKPTNAIHADSPGIYTSEKVLKKRQKIKSI